MKRLFLYAMACMLVWVAPMTAQTDYRQRLLTMDNGMPSNTTRCLLQDNRGFIWMGTENGLCRYDGKMFMNYPIEENGLDQRVSALLNDGSDGLFVGTNKGVFRFSFETEQFVQLPFSTEHAVNSMVIDIDNNLWVSTRGGGVSCLPTDATDEDTPVEYPMKEINGEVAKIYVDNNNQIWALTNRKASSIWKLNKSKNQFEQVKLVSDRPYNSACMLQTNDGSRWLGTWENGLMLINDDGTLEMMPQFAMGHGLHIRTLFELSAQELLVGCDDGLWRFDIRNRTFSLYLPQHFVCDMILDREGGQWIASYFGGVSYISPISSRFNATPGGIISRFCEDRQGRIWVASNNQGINCYQGGKQLNGFPGESKLTEKNIHALGLNGDDLWIGSYSNGIFVLNTLNGQVRHYIPNGTEHSLYDANIYAIFMGSNNQIWVATLEGLCRYDRTTDSFERVGTLSSIVSDIDEDTRGRLWIATNGNGMICYTNEGKFKTYLLNKNEQNQKVNMVNCSLIDNNGELWVGTQAGLFRYDQMVDSFTTVKLDVPKQAVASIVEDQGSLWLAGDFGVLKYDMKDGSTQRFTRQDGLVSEQFQTNSCMKDRDGRIYFGTFTGFSSFFPYQIQVNRLAPPVYLTQLEIHNHPVEVDNWHLGKALPYMDKLDFYYNDRVFSISFASLSYCSPEKNIYAYMLEGFDKDWTYVSSDQKATYTNLSAGTYTFRVRATNNDGLWSEQEARIKIVVHPPFWWSTPAQIAYVIMAIVLIWLVIYLRLKLAERRHRKEMALLSEAKEEEVRQARMKFFTMIAHEIRTPVSLIIAPLEKMKDNIRICSSQNGGTPKPTPEMIASVTSSLDTIDRNAHRLLDLVNQLLDFRKVEQNKQELNFSTQDIGELLRNVVSDFEQTFSQNGRQFTATYPKTKLTAVVDREALVKVVSNLLSNANKYSNTKIELLCGLLPDNDSFFIEVDDDGQGIDKNDLKHIFDPFYQGRDNKPGTGIGLSIVKEIISQHKGRIDVKSEVGEGTCFRIELPLRHDHEVVNDSSQIEKPAAAPTAEQATPLIEEQPRKHLLIVDDNEEMLTFLVTTFMDEYEVLSARDGSEALNLLEKSLVVKEGDVPTSTVDIIISDWMMNSMDGPEFCRRLRQNAATRHIPFVLLTAKTDSQSKIEAMDAGADAFIEKPFAVKYLEACLRNLLKRAER